VNTKSQFEVCFILDTCAVSKYRHYIGKWIYESGSQKEGQVWIHKFGKFSNAQGIDEITQRKSLGRVHNEFWDWDLRNNLTPSH
jgi:hypothetical protein